MVEGSHPAEAPGVTLALGGGGARGLAHAGVLATLVDAGIPVRAVVGTSIGAEIGAFYCVGLGPDRIEDMVREMDWMATFRLFWPSLEGGALTSGRNIEAYLRERLGNGTFEGCDPPFRAVATDMRTGQQVVLDDGGLVEGVRASIALPGLIKPFKVDGRLLGDGGLVNPLPVDVARRRFGGPVVAVAVHPGARGAGERAEEPDPFQESEEESAGPALIANLQRAVQITQAQLVRLRLEASPPDLTLKPVVPGMSTLEFYRGGEALEAGRKAAIENLDRIRALAEPA
ncbi:patatin-like phospholipase family protein [Thiohalorhabdus denitrificans]|uniref:NTE family protein n=1 Tax=Thiohalorhabdus denitrificans TaxID=381306 RepID=A0A1G5C411_9GAMM|nr:patatin-like phospholipase family protein [Thiohalorhabdus denitrificans]SCX97066.1 NTE family protein [Thiohalorhabdus denitrificans]